MPEVWDNATELDKLRAASEIHMPDDGQRLVWSVSIDSVGDDIETWTAGSTTICGVETHEGRENKSEMTSTYYEITVRVPYDFVIDQKDHFKITLFKGQTVDWEYEITTPIRFGVANKRFGARQVVH